MSRTAAGDREAFDLLVQEHQQPLYRFALAVTKDPAVAEDVLQETFLTAYRRAGSFRGEGSVRGWLYSIARHAAYRMRRRRAGEPAQHESLQELGLAAGWGSEGESSPISSEVERDLVHRALATLDAEDQEILLLREVEGFSGAETASLLGLSIPAMKSRLHRARLRFAGAAREGGFDGTR